MTLAFAAGLAIPLGGLLASVTHLRSKCRELELDSFVLYFGGGALAAAITLVLIPEGVDRLSWPWATLWFLAGGLGFWRLTVWQNKTESSAGMFVGTMSDFVPEAILLGAAALAGSPTVYLLAGLIGLQNLPEGFATYESMRGQGGGGSKRLWVLLSVAPFAGPLAAWLGYGLFADSDAALGGLILACSGGILFLIFDDIAPKAKLKNEDFPALGAVLGYLLGLVGHMLTG